MAIRDLLLAVWGGVIALAGSFVWGLLGRAVVSLVTPTPGFVEILAGLALLFVGTCVTVPSLYALVRIVEKHALRRNAPSLAIGAFVGAELGLAVGIFLSPGSYVLPYVAASACAIGGVWIHSRALTFEQALERRAS